MIRQPRLLLTVVDASPGQESAVPHLSLTTLTADEQRLILRATAGNIRDHTIIFLALGTGLRQVVQ